MLVISTLNMFSKCKCLNMSIFGCLKIAGFVSLSPFALCHVFGVNGITINMWKCTCITLWYAWKFSPSLCHCIRIFLLLSPPSCFCTHFISLYPNAQKSHKNMLPAFSNFRFESFQKWIKLGFGILWKRKNPITVSQSKAQKIFVHA